MLSFRPFEAPEDVYTRGLGQLSAYYPAPLLRETALWVLGDFPSLARSKVLFKRGRLISMNRTLT